MDEKKQKAGWLARGDTRIPDLGRNHQAHPLLLWWQPIGLALLCLPRWTGCERCTWIGWRPGSLVLLSKSQQLHQWFHCARPEGLFLSRAEFWRGKQMAPHMPEWHLRLHSHLQLYPSVLSRPPCSSTPTPGGDRKAFPCS